MGDAAGEWQGGVRGGRKGQVHKTKIGGEWARDCMFSGSI